MAQTKYQLMAELRELNRGNPRLAISGMRKHELESNIDALKKFKGIQAESMEGRVPAKPGPLGSRSIPVEEEEDGDVVIKTPKAPAPRVSAKPKEPKVVVTAATAAKKAPKEPKEPELKSKSSSVTVKFGACEHCGRK
jgi:hypothetical protein